MSCWQSSVLLCVVTTGVSAAVYLQPMFACQARCSVPAVPHSYLLVLILSKLSDASSQTGCPVICLPAMQSASWHTS